MVRPSDVDGCHRVDVPLPWRKAFKKPHAAVKVREATVHVHACTLPWSRSVTAAPMWPDLEHIEDEKKWIPILVQGCGFKNVLRGGN